jgi:sec-independent protein translocase protein TatC
MALLPFPRSTDDSAADSSPWNGSEGESGGAKMTFLEHLDELRKRIVISVAAIAVGCAIAFAFVDRIYAFVMDPLYAMLPKHSALVYTEPTEAFILWVWMAFLAGLILAMPIVLWQVWLFIAPGLYQKEKRLAIPFIVLASVGFLTGAAFTHFLLFPWMWTFFASFAGEKLTFYPRIEPVFDLYVKMILGMGLVFQMPALVYVLSRIGLVTARFLVRSFKYAILVIFVLAAVITPSGDMLTQTMFALPMIGLYLISIVIAWIFGKPRRAEPAEE